MQKNINVSARQERHSQVNFKAGEYYKKKMSNRKTLFRFLLNVISLFAAFFIFYTLSQDYVSAYPEGFQEFDETLVRQIESEDVFVLGANGFVIKPSAQTEEGDRSTSNEIIEYAVEPGDTIYGIAAKFSIKAKTLTDNNSGISKWSVLKPGKVLRILPVDGLLHEVSKKDTIASIAKKYKIKKEDILRQNQLTADSSIQGKNIIIPGAKKAVSSGGYSSPMTAPSVYAGDLSGDFVWPANGKITQYYHRWHYALDIANRGKGPIYAAANGTVIKAQGGWNGGYGNMVIIDHGNGFKTLYAHNDKLYVSVGDTVQQGQTIAWMGNTGRVYGVTGIHLHFELIKNGVKKNPIAYLGKR